MGSKKLLRNQQGFTLIEIIAVLVLLGILAAVAVPKYMSMQEKAELKSVAGVKAELASRAAQYHGQYLLDQTGGSAKATQSLADWADATKEDIGSDFDLDADGTDLQVKVISTGKCYNIPFTVGTVNTAAKFGTIAADTCI